METGRTIVFLSDFGYRNEWVGICHAVMNRVAPDSPIVDLSHGVPALDVRGGAVLLADSLPYLSGDAIVLAIVDPSVGRDRDVALETEGRSTDRRSATTACSHLQQQRSGASPAQSR